MEAKASESLGSVGSEEEQNSLKFTSRVLVW